MKAYTDSELIYSAYNRCPCGAGLAYIDNKDPGGFWDCSAILKNEAVENGQPGALTHCPQYPFIFYEIKSEKQPSAAGSTTRPK